MKNLFVLTAAIVQKEKLLEELITSATNLSLAYSSKETPKEEIESKEKKLIMFAQMIYINLGLNGDTEKIAQMIKDINE